MSRKYKFHEKNGAYFVSFATVNWIDVFTRDIYFAIIIESLDHCRKNKGMEIYGYCIMPSHVHLIFRSAIGDPSGLMRDLKGFTSRKLMKTIENNWRQSTREQERMDVVDVWKSGKEKQQCQGKTVLTTTQPTNRNLEFESVWTKAKLHP